MSKKNQVSYVKPAEPAFLRKFKEEVGFKEGPTVETKKLRPPGPPEDSDDDSDSEDELPQVVVLGKDDLTAEEALELKQQLKEQQHKESSKEVATEDAPEDGKIVFKKPAKRASDDKFSGLTATSSKKKKEEKKSSRWDATSRPEAIKNSSLLSFGDDEEED